MAYFYYVELRDRVFFLVMLQGHAMYSLELETTAMSVGAAKQHLLARGGKECLGKERRSVVIRPRRIIIIGALSLFFLLP